MSKKYDSKLEEKFHTNNPTMEHHPKVKIPYVIEAEYNPDFIHNQNNKTYFIETKGRFRDRKESSKYVAVLKSLKENEELIFVLMKQNVPMPNAKQRKDGTKQTHEEFLEKNGIRYFYINTFNTEEL